MTIRATRAPESDSLPHGIVADRADRPAHVRPRPERKTSGRLAAVVSAAVAFTIGAAVAVAAIVVAAP